jgi:hypothetical protein
MTHPHELGKHRSDEWWATYGARHAVPRCTHVRRDGTQCAAVALFGKSCGRHGYRPEPHYDTVGIVRVTTRTGRTKR